MKTKTYLGDGVYAHVTEWGDLELTTENGINVTNFIVLEPAVMAELLRFIETLKPTV